MWAFSYCILVDRDFHWPLFIYLIRSYFIHYLPKFWQWNVTHFIALFEKLIIIVISLLECMFYTKTFQLLSLNNTATTSKQF